MVVGFYVVPRSSSDPTQFSGSGYLDPMPGFSFLNLLKHDELHLNKTTKRARIFLHFWYEMNKDVPTPLYNLQSFHLTIYEQTASRSNRPTSCFKHLKIVPNSESCWRKKKPAPDYSCVSTAFGLFLPILKRKKNDECVCGEMKEEALGCIFLKIFHNFLPLFQFPSKYFHLQLYLCMPEGLFPSNSQDCTKVLQSDTFFIMSFPTKHHTSPGTPGHEALPPAAIHHRRGWCTSNHTPSKILECCPSKALCHVQRSGQQVECFLKTGFSNLPHWFQSHPWKCGTWCRAHPGVWEEGCSKGEEWCGKSAGTGRVTSRIHRKMEGLPWLTRGAVQEKKGSITCSSSSRGNSGLQSSPSLSPSSWSPPS